MPRGNRFQHQAYTDAPPAKPAHLITPASFPPVGSGEFRRRMHEVGDSLRAAGVTVVYLVHGSFVGPDALSIAARLARGFPSAARTVRRLIRQARHSTRLANYTETYARLFESSINRSGADAIRVQLFDWSSENHHLGRADGAVRLVNRLASLDIQTPQRVLLWGHGHAGNVFALASNLLSGDVESVDRFFSAADVYYRWPMARCVDIPVWHRVRELLVRHGRLPNEVVPDVVTFGTPIRYGWDSSGYGRLLHFVYHRLAEGLPEYRAPFPPEVDDMLDAAGGDYVQQLGIAGTNLRPGIFAWRARLADRRLGQLLEAGSALGSPLDRFRAGLIVPDEGTTLLVDYGQPQGDISQHHGGHAVYTHRDWLLFHAEEVIRQLYSAKARQAA